MEKLQWMLRKNNNFKNYFHNTSNLFFQVKIKAFM